MKNMYGFLEKDVRVFERNKEAADCVSWRANGIFAGC